MRLPFTLAQFLDGLRQYNEAVWPAQAVLVACALIAVAAAARAGEEGSRAPGGILAALWLWMGIAYHWAFFRRVNPAAALFGAAFVGEGALLAWLAASGRLRVHAIRSGRAVAGGILVAYALVLYPALARAFGHGWPAMPTFGLPCPTTIFTFGILLWADRPVTRWTLVVPALWAVVGTSAAVTLGMREDFALVAAALVALPALLRTRSRPRVLEGMRHRAA